MEPAPEPQPESSGEPARKSPEVITASAPASELSAPPGAKPSARSGSAVRRLVEWFWRGRALREVRARGAVQSASAVELTRRARLAAELARQALEPARPFAEGSAHALAAELYRQSVYWALRAHAEITVAPRTDLGSAAVLDVSGEVAPLWRAADPQFILDASGTADKARELEAELAGRSFVHFAELELADQTRIAQNLRPLAESLIKNLDSRRVEYDMLWLQRVLRVLLLLVVLGAIAAAVLMGLESRERASDLAQGKPWKASSAFSSGGCRSPLQECTDSPEYFVHTQEQDNPWVEFDLGAVQQLSRAKVKNRVSCCTERAVPLVLEVSVDQKRWVEVARKDKPFDTWAVSFAPTRARWVRLRVPRITSLHLREVRLLP